MFCSHFPAFQLCFVWEDSSQLYTIKTCLTCQCRPSIYDCERRPTITTSVAFVQTTWLQLHNPSGAVRMVHCTKRRPYILSISYSNKHVLGYLWKECDMNIVSIIQCKYGLDLVLTFRFLTYSDLNRTVTKRSSKYSKTPQMGRMTE